MLTLLDQAKKALLSSKQQG